jgi:hypothetical protein
MMYPGIGAASFTDGTSDFNTISFIVRQIMARAAHMAIVQVTGISGNTVNVNPLVNQVDGVGNTMPHGIVNGLAYIQWQGGTSAIELTPAVGDIGIAVFADNDISSVKNTGRAANPGSMRRNSMSDGVYFGGIMGLNPTPTQFVNMIPGAGGISITTPATLTLNAGGKTWTFGASGLTMSDGLIAENHKHGGVTFGSSETGPPNA